ncbi:diguanylate cyclase (GGDEF)-like protein [Paenibacillus sp. PastF-1]|nr:diguanylate cyclase (GGDEF)-like protein [Paenibacillus sp. PastF-2]MDF9847488.1 diguanylate cyclase (GGDEF)-like protein [Paenibacillus sp. PastM-2]MDF9853935.1 diguanylate cyclase (GGDEF)-like protein [Paenibacillus sp. PastF-1]MDH6479207.1 diguanylate cyclase (GGDEF)-like protein [Paenibacillus sp. PastH-2]MDH6507057.1 diguanylate cyclase (GGDEF)-like protein [Paenibacillus sp. PastM-3]
MHIPPPPPRQSYWNRVLLNTFWMVLLVCLASQLFISLSMWGHRPEFTDRQYFVTHVLIPDSFILVLILTLEAIYRWKPAFSEFSIVVASHIYAILIITNLSTEYEVKPLIMLLPLLVSMIYLKSSYMKASSLICLLYTVMLFMNTPVYEYTMRIQHIIIALIFAGTALAGFGVIGRGRDLMRSLQDSVKAEQDLRIQNIIMDRLSKIDPLTDLYNHKTFHEYLGWLIDHQQNNPFPMQLAVLDIDNFKKVNDQYGHWVGDIVLKQVAAVVLKHIGTDDFAARYGGEEFVVILTAKQMKEAQEIMERILTGIAGMPIEEMNGGSVTVSIGMHEFSVSDTKSYTFQQADDALYEAKKTGKNKIVLK